MKVVLFLLFGTLALAGLAFLLVSRSPAPHLVDAAGGALTPEGALGAQRLEEPRRGDPEEPGAPVDAFDPFDPFDEVRALREARELGAAKERLVTLLAESDRDGEACTLLSEVCRELGELEEAADYAAKAVALVPDWPAAHVARARALGAQLQQDLASVAGMLRAMSRLGEFRGAIERVLELDPEDLEGRKLEILLHLAPPPIGDHGRALALAEELEALDPLSGLYWRAVVHQRREESDAAVELCRAGRERFPEDLAFPLLLGQLLVKRGELDEADACFAAILGASAKGGSLELHQARYERAKLRIEEGFELEVALELLDAYLEAQPRGDFLPRPAHALWRKGMALEGLGRREEALSAYRESVRLDPEFASSKSALAKLEAAG